MYWHLFFTIFLLLLVLWIVYTIVSSYKASQNVGWKRFLDTGRGSLTIVWTKFGAIVAALVGLVDGGLVLIGNVTNDPSATSRVETAVNSWLTPQTASLAMLGFFLITAIARFRSLGK